MPFQKKIYFIKTYSDNSGVVFKKGTIRDVFHEVNYQYWLNSGYAISLEKHLENEKNKKQSLKEVVTKEDNMIVEIETKKHSKKTKKID